jgi:hypothetical protein
LEKNRGGRRSKKEKCRSMKNSSSKMAGKDEMLRKGEGLNKRRKEKEIFKIV